MFVVDNVLASIHRGLSLRDLAAAFRVASCRHLTGTDSIHQISGILTVHCVFNYHWSSGVIKKRAMKLSVMNYPECIIIYRPSSVQLKSVHLPQFIFMVKLPHISFQLL